MGGLEMRRQRTIVAVVAFGATAGLAGCAGMSVGEGASAVTGGFFSAAGDTAIAVGRSGVFDAVADAAILVGRGGADVVDAMLDTVPFPASATAPAPTPASSVPAPPLR
jgi:hypothetical protein